MEDKARAVLAEVLCEVLEHFAFAFAEQLEPKQCSCPQGPGLHATMDVRGGVRAAIGLAAPVVLCEEFAANVLGVDRKDGAAEAHAADVLQELLNVVCGRFLTSLCGEEPVFEVGTPQLEGLDASGWSDLAKGAGVLSFLVEGGPLLAYVAVESG